MKSSSLLDTSDWTALRRAAYRTAFASAIGAFDSELIKQLTPRSSRTFDCSMAIAFVLELQPEPEGLSGQRQRQNQNDPASVASTLATHCVYTYNLVELNSLRADAQTLSDKCEGNEMQQNCIRLD